jgi:predicted lipoprotein with Yx(FWY)xxD motif
MRRTIGAACAVILAAVAQADVPKAAAPEVPPDVTVHRELDRYVFADGKGMVLYFFDKDQDTPGSSSCTLDKHCSRQWPPLIAPADAKPVGDWTIIRRPDGKPQWAYKAKPVYRYADDITPGVASGDNARQLWHTVAEPIPAPHAIMPAGFRIVRAEDRWAFATHEGRVLYAPLPQAECDDTCRARWEAVPAPLLARKVGEWQPVPGADASPQWSFRGRPLYVLKTGQPASAADEANALRVLHVDAASVQR